MITTLEGRSGAACADAAYSVAINIVTANASTITRRLDTARPPRKLTSRGVLPDISLPNSRSRERPSLASLRMETFPIGGDLEVHRLGFGAMRITGEGIWGPPDDPEEATRLLRRVVELGIDLIDTADSYGPEVSENLVAEALLPYPDELVIATKGGLRRTGPGGWPHDARPERLKECCEGSLRRLRLERIDLYQLHAPDPKVPYEDSIGALKELQNEGKIRHVGVSNVSMEQLEQARAIVDVVSVQNRYSLTERHSEDVLEACERAGIAFIPWFPLATGSF